MKRFLKKTILCCVFTLGGLYVFAADNDGSDFNPINTAMPSLTIAPDARGGGMGDVGAATMPDIYSQHWNPAKYPFTTSKAGVALSYTPWLRKLVNDIALIYGVGYYKFGNEGNQAVSASIRYFSIGDVALTDLEGNFWKNVSPYEMAFDVAYSRKLTETFSGSVAFRYIRADFTTGDENTEESPGSAYAADIAGYNESYIMLGSAECLLGLGFNISNIGTKISTNGGAINNFIPTNLRLGASLTYPLDDYNTLAFSLDMNKLLVPSLPKLKDGQSETDRNKEYSDMNPISGIFKSFGDAPGGFKEELQEIMWSVGAEYTYNQQFSIRAGYFNENQNKGNRQYFTAGAGFKMSVFQLDAAYLVSTADTNPLDQTLRFSLSFDMDGLSSLFNR